MSLEDGQGASRTLPPSPPPASSDRVFSEELMCFNLRRTAVPGGVFYYSSGELMHFHVVF